HVVRNLLRALGCKFIEPINEHGVPATLLDETAQAVTTIAPALVAGDASSLPMRSLKMIAPSRGMGAIIA
ncbi:MAG: hypothetical protein WB685_01400, partial [Pseudolabrys sp.]